MPTFRRFPADGLNHIHDFSIMFESVMSSELITFKDTAMLYRTAPHVKKITLDRQIVTEVSIPSQIYSRFISQFYNIADEQLCPAFKDMQESGHTLLEKKCHILDYHFTYRIFISEGQNGLERLVRLSIQKEAYSKRPSLDHISMDPNGFNPRSHERGIDGSTTPETSLTKCSEAASRQAATSFSQTQPESRIQINFKI